MRRLWKDLTIVCESDSTNKKTNVNIKYSPCVYTKRYSLLPSICTKSDPTIWERKWWNDPPLKTKFNNTHLDLVEWYTSLYLFVCRWCILCKPLHAFIHVFLFFFFWKKSVYIFAITRYSRFRFRFHMFLIHFKNELSIRFFVSVTFPKCSAYFSAIYEIHVEKASLAKSDDQSNCTQKKIMQERSAYWIWIVSLHLLLHLCYDKFWQSAKKILSCQVIRMIKAEEDGKTRRHEKRK